MNRYRFSASITEFIYQFPKIMMLNLCWLLASLLILSLVTSTRALIASLMALQKQEPTNFETLRIFKDEFSFFLHADGKRDMVTSFYVWALIFDKVFFASQLGAESQILSYAIETILFLVSMLCLYQTYLSISHTKHVHSFVALYSFLKNPLKILLHFVLSLALFYLLLHLGPIYLCLSGGSLFFLVNLALIYVFNKKTETK